jgi:UPF0716 protein FxsA
VLPLLVLLFILVPIAEIALLLQIGDLVGLWWTIALLIADAILGSLLLRSQGRRAWRRFSDALQEGRPPAREVTDGALIVVGGALLLTPGFISDLGGLAFLLPPTRALIRRLLLRRLGRRMVMSMTTPRGGATRGQPYDVEGSATDVAGEERRLP